MSSQLPKIGYVGVVAPPSPKELGATLDRFAYVTLCALIFVLPWEDTVPLFGGFVISRWIGLLAFGMAALRTSVFAQTRRLCELHYWMLVFAVWSTASIFWTVDWASTAGRVSTYLQLLVLAWLIWLLATSHARVLGLLTSYIFGTSVCAVGTILNLMAGRSFGQLDDIDGPASARYTVTGLNPNDLGLMLALSIPMTLYLLAQPREHPAKKILYWVQFMLCMVTIALSGSRGATLAAGAALLMFPVTVVRLPRWQKGLAATACVGVVASAIYLVPEGTWQRLFRLGTEVTEGTMTHRTQIWAAGVEVFRDHPLFGVGSGAHAAAVVGILGRPLVAHNTFLSVLVELGVIGELLLLGLLGAGLCCAVLRMRGLKRALWLLILLTWSIGVCGGTWEYRKVTWFLMSLLAAHAYARFKPALRRTRAQSPPVVNGVMFSSYSVARRSERVLGSRETLAAMNAGRHNE